jgi:hypothetical protein
VKACAVALPLGSSATAGDPAEDAAAILPSLLEVVHTRHTDQVLPLALAMRFDGPAYFIYWENVHHGSSVSAVFSASIGDFIFLTPP